MRARLVAALVVLSTGCSRAPAVGGDASGAPPPPASAVAPQPAATPLPLASTDDCTGETALVPGVPGSPGHLLPSDINPNGASELAALMRTMVADLEAVRASIDGSGMPPGALYAKHRKIRCAWFTDPAERTPEHDAFAQVYLARIQALDAKPADRRAAYEDVISACKSCHERSCSGPLARIEKLRLAPRP